MTKDTLLTLLRAFGATGREEPVRAIIKDMVTPFADEVYEDVMGNLVAIKRAGSPDAKRVMLSAHMDHIGLIVTEIDDDGFVRVHPVGGIGGNSILANHVWFENGTHGVIYYELDREYPDNKVPTTRMFVDIGAKSREEAEARVSIGDVCVFAPDIFVQGSRITAPAMDDRVGCAVAVEVLRAFADGSVVLKNDIIAVFSTQEEVGLRGAKTAAYAADPDIGIALDVTMAGDTPKANRIKISLGGGVAIKVMDRASISNPALRDSLIKTATENNIPYQLEVLPYGGTDAGAIQQTKGGVAVCTLSIPCRYVHSACETVDEADLEATVSLLVAQLSKQM